jgi:hypothetical protein
MKRMFIIITLFIIISIDLRKGIIKKKDNELLISTFQRLGYVMNNIRIKLVGEENSNSYDDFLLTRY